MRAHIAKQTRSIHEDLHHNPILKCLTKPTVTEHQYLAALGVLSNFYHAVERERHRSDTWHDFSLTTECDALRKDVSGTNAVLANLEFATPFELLGGLYVAHGASFGREVFRQNLEAALPRAPKFFVNMRTSKAVWRLLTECMEHHGQDRRKLREVQNGAMTSFEAVKQLSSATPLL